MLTVSVNTYTVTQIGANLDIYKVVLVLFHLTQYIMYM